jgi:hypothetical protein
VNDSATAVDVAPLERRFEKQEAERRRREEEAREEREREKLEREIEFSSDLRSGFHF